MTNGIAALMLRASESRSRGSERKLVRAVPMPFLLRTFDDDHTCCELVGQCYSLKIRYWVLREIRLF